MGEAVPGALVLGGMASTDADEIAELQALFASTPSRESQLPVGAYAKFTAHYDNAVAAKALRERKAELKAQRIREEEKRRQKVKEIVRAEASQNQKIKEKQDAIKLRNINNKREQREVEAKWEEERVARDRAFAEAGRVRVLEAKALDARLDKQEEEVDAQERKEGKEEKEARLAEAAKLKKQMLQYNKVRRPASPCTAAPPHAGRRRRAVHLVRASWSPTSLTA